MSALPCILAAVTGLALGYFLTSPPSHIPITPLATPVPTHDPDPAPPSTVFSRETAEFEAISTATLAELPSHLEALQDEWHTVQAYKYPPLAERWATLSPRGGLNHALDRDNSRFALALIAAWTRVDPDAAVAYVRKWPPNEGTPYVYAALLDALATTNPARFRVLLPTFAENLPRLEKSSLTEPFFELARTDLGAATNLVEYLPDGDREHAIAAIAKTYADADLDAATRWALALAPAPLRTAALREVAVSTGTVASSLVNDFPSASSFPAYRIGREIARGSDRATAIAWIHDLPYNPEDTIGDLLDLAVTDLVRSDPATAFANLSAITSKLGSSHRTESQLEKFGLADYPAIAASITPQTNHTLLQAFTKKWLLSNPADAIPWLGSFAPSVRDTPTRHALLGTASQLLQDTDPADTDQRLLPVLPVLKDFFLSLPTEDQQATATELGELLAASHHPDSTALFFDLLVPAGAEIPPYVSRKFARLAHLDNLDALSQLETLTDPSQRSAAAGAIAQSWAAYNHAAARVWVESLAQTGERDHASAGVARAVSIRFASSISEYSDALRLGAAISDPDLRKQTTLDTVSDLSISALKMAAETIPTLHLPPAEKDALLDALETRKARFE